MMAVNKITWQKVKKDVTTLKDIEKYFQKYFPKIIFM